MDFIYFDLWRVNFFHFSQKTFSNLKSCVFTSSVFSLDAVYSFIGMTKAAPRLLYEDNAVRNEEQGRNNICIPSEM